MELWTLTVEAWRLKMEPWMVCRPVVADSHHSDEKQDPNPHLSEKSDHCNADPQLFLK
jgi:hypothetical protein